MMFHRFAYGVVNTWFNKCFDQIGWCIQCLHDIFNSYMAIFGSFLQYCITHNLQKVICQVQYGFQGPLLLQMQHGYHSFRFLMCCGTPVGIVIPLHVSHVTSCFSSRSKVGFCRIRIFWSGWVVEPVMTFTKRLLCHTTILARNSVSELSIVHLSARILMIGLKQKPCCLTDVYIFPSFFEGIVQTNVSQKPVICDILQVFLVTNSFYFAQLLSRWMQ